MRDGHVYKARSGLGNGILFISRKIKHKAISRCIALDHMGLCQITLINHDARRGKVNNRISSLWINISNKTSDE